MDILIEIRSKRLGKKSKYCILLKKRKQRIGKNKALHIIEEKKKEDCLSFIPKRLIFSSSQSCVYCLIMVAGARLLMTFGVRISSPVESSRDFSPSGKSFIKWFYVIKSKK